MRWRKRTGTRFRVVALSLVGAVAAALAVTALSLPAFAQQFPNVANLKPFSPEANFMSLPGYLRWLTFQQTGQWITYAEAVRIVQQQVSP